MILGEIRDRLPELTPNFRKIASYILDHEQSVAFSSIYAISSAIGVSSSSLVRFAKILGLTGYQDLKRQVQDEIKDRLRPYNKVALRELDLLPEEKRLQKLFLNELDNLRNTFDTIRPGDLQAMVASIRRSRKIFTSGFGASRHLVRVFEYTLKSSLDKEVTAVTGSVSDYSPALKSFTAKDAMFLMTFPPYSDEVRHVAKVAKDRGGALHLFTDSAACPVYSLADTVVKCDTNSLLLTNSYVGLVSILNILVHLVFLGSAKTTIESRSRTLTMQDEGYAAMRQAAEKP